jgi:hypothetical protein
LPGISDKILTKIDNLREIHRSVEQQGKFIVAPSGQKDISAHRLPVAFGKRCQN